MKFYKYHALGNDYMVVRPSDTPQPLHTKLIQHICHRHYGIGSDGILLGPLESKVCDFGLKILNPDGSEAEKSGNGLRIFARFLFDEGLVSTHPFTVQTLGGNVTCEVKAEGKQVTVEMGEVSFDSEVIPILGITGEAVNESIKLKGHQFTYCAATVGNPHCVVIVNDPTPALAQELGPLIEVDSRFPNRTNVQFMKILDDKNIQIEIWERGAGYTLASGSSSTAAAAVAHKLGKCGPKILVHMPGGQLKIQFKEGYHATMTGPVTKVSEGTMTDEALEEVEP